MKKERLLNAIGQIDDRLISGADPQVHMHRKKNSPSMDCGAGGMSRFDDRYRRRCPDFTRKSGSGEGNDGD